jgi:hypothetical protein
MFTARMVTGERETVKCTELARVHNNFLGTAVSGRCLDSGFRRNDRRSRDVIPGKAVGRDPESRILLYTQLVLRRLEKDWTMVRSVLTGGDLWKALELEANGNRVGIIIGAVKMGLLRSRLAGRKHTLKADPASFETWRSAFRRFG